MYTISQQHNYHKYIMHIIIILQSCYSCYSRIKDIELKGMNVEILFEALSNIHLLFSPSRSKLTALRAAETSATGMEFSYGSDSKLL